MGETLVKGVFVPCHCSNNEFVSWCFGLVDAFEGKILTVLMLEFVVKVGVLIYFVFRHYLNWMRLSLCGNFLRRGILDVLKRFLQIDNFHLRSFLSHKFNRAWISFSIKVIHAGVH